ncbi:MULTISPECIES: hypothetical protein [unclassified Colwellia]|uniref:hypothetical protein n=1 Tax=unclassified Colwellia TaxID=196834 RepID=UPI0015F39FC9|nr:MULTISPECIES: hypothetical protein [unclassified Colwellia]MBA6256252.1 hypothetical protein [Colwellia sp. MB3u-28]MBA6260136.1 hypothetical protein [Colwellia sp. MB3u-41]
MLSHQLIELKSNLEKSLPDNSSCYKASIFPSLFVDAVIPFYGVTSADEELPMSVDPWLTIGGTFQRYEKLSEVDAKELFEQLNGLTKLYFSDSSFWDGNVARYEYIKPFNIFVAGEGKNRVELFRQYNTAIKAAVRSYGYFTPSSINLTYYPLNKTYQFEAVYRGKSYCMPVLFPSVTVNLLKEYGARIMNSYNPINTMKNSNKLNLKRDRLNLARMRG